MSVRFAVKGKQAAIEQFLDELEQDEAISADPGVSIGGISPVSEVGALRRPLGLEPLVYFFVVYSAHLAAGVTHDKIKEWLESRAKASVSNISVEEHKEEPVASEKTSD